MDGGTFAIGQTVGLIHEIKSVAEVIDDIVRGATQIYERLGKMLDGDDGRQPIDCLPAD